MTRSGRRKWDGENGMGRVVFQCVSVIIARCFPIFRRHVPVFRRHFIICHAGVADVPCRRGKRAVPAWQTCRAGVANHQVPCTNGKISRKNGCAPCRNGGRASRSVRTLPGGRRTAGGDGEHTVHWDGYGRGGTFCRTPGGRAPCQDLPARAQRSF